MHRARKIFGFGILVVLVLSFTGCSLFGPKLHGKTHVAKAISGAKQIQATKEGKEVNDKLLEMYNAELVLAYQETELAMSSASKDVALYLNMPYASYQELAVLSEAVKASYGNLIVSAVDYPALVKGLDKEASRAMFEEAKAISTTSDPAEGLTSKISYIKKATELNAEYEAEGKALLIDLYIRVGDTKVVSTKIGDIEAATSYYQRALTLDKNNQRVAEKLAFAENKLIEIKVVQIRETLENGKTYQEFRDALRVYGSLGSELGKKYGYLESGLEEKLTADILICVGPNSGFESLDSPEVSTPSWPTNVSDKKPKTIKIEYKHFPSLNIKVPTTHTYILVPDADFGKITYDFDSTTSKDITVDSTSSAVERSLRETQLQQDPNNMEARNALAKGTYKEIKITLTMSVNDIYHVYKVENGKPVLKASTNARVSKKTFDQIKFISGSKAPIELKTGISFTRGDMGGDEFEPNKSTSYFTEPSLNAMYGRKIRKLTQFYDLLW